MVFIIYNVVKWNQIIVPITLSPTELLSYLSNATSLTVALQPIKIICNWKFFQGTSFVIFDKVCVILSDWLRLWKFNASRGWPVMMCFSNHLGYKFLSNDSIVLKCIHFTWCIPLLIIIRFYWYAELLCIAVRCCCLAALCLLQLLCASVIR